MSDIKTLLKKASRKFQNELEQICSTTKPTFSASLDLFSQLVAGKNYSEMIHKVQNSELNFLPIPSLFFVVNELKRKGEDVTTQQVSFALINAIGRSSIEVFFPVLSSTVAKVKDSDTETLAVNFRNIGLVASYTPGYLPIVDHSFQNEESSDAETFIKAMLGQSDNTFHRIFTENQKCTKAYSDKRVLGIIYRDSFVEKAVNVLLGVGKDEFGCDATIHDIAEKFGEREEIEGLISYAFSYISSNDNLVSWDEGVGSLFSMLVAQSIDDELKLVKFEDESFNWDANSLKPVVSYTRQRLKDILTNINS